MRHRNWAKADLHWKSSSGSGLRVPNSSKTSSSIKEYNLNHDTGFLLESLGLVFLWDVVEDKIREK